MSEPSFKGVISKYHSGCGGSKKETCIPRRFSPWRVAPSNAAFALLIEAGVANDTLNELWPLDELVPEIVADLQSDLRIQNVAIMALQELCESTSDSEGKVFYEA
ncbi:hypothetical protein MMC09_001363 [Bachmanniomyces sp. S44760]|nr:hypothetical protein [Bachmanniomyces sp. S44760]